MKTTAIIWQDASIDRKHQTFSKFGVSSTSAIVEFVAYSFQDSYLPIQSSFDAAQEGVISRPFTRIYDYYQTILYFSLLHVQTTVAEFYRPESLT